MVQSSIGPHMSVSSPIIDKQVTEVKALDPHGMDIHWVH